MILDMMADHEAHADEARRVLLAASLTREQRTVLQAQLLRGEGVVAYLRSGWPTNGSDPRKVEQ